jgi:polysaccharide pyruvyl transferase CsaB
MKKPASTVVISGYYGFDNAGDEAVLFSIIKTLRDLHPDLRLIVLSQDPPKTAKAYGVEAVNRWNGYSVFKALRQAELLISGGGSLLQDVTSPRNILYYLGIVWLAKLMRRRVIFYSQGIGPVNGVIGRSLVKKVANLVDVITIRDERSRKELSNMGVTKPPIYQTADPVLGLSRQDLDLQAGRELLTRNGIDLCRPVLGVSVREWRGLTGYYKVLAKGCDHLARLGWQVVFIPMHFPADIAPSREVARLMQEPAVILRDKSSVATVMGVIGHAGLMLGMRLHALIMAAVAGVPVVGVSYDPKVTSFLKQVEQPVAGKVETLTEAELIQTLNQVLPDLSNLQQKVMEQVAELRQEARKAAHLTLELLGK